MPSVNTSRIVLSFRRRGLLLCVLLAAGVLASGTEICAAAAPPAQPASPPSPAAAAKDAALPAGERLLKELEAAPGVTLGSNRDAPLLYVFVMPDNPACRKIWNDVSAAVKAGKLRVRLFPAGLKGSNDERAAARLLASPHPLAAWDKYAGGDSAALAGKPAPAALDKVRILTALIDRWRFPAAPYLVYRGRDGQVKVVEGTPTDSQAVIGDAAPEQRKGAKP
jgi:hypothetical protein